MFRRKKETKLEVEYVIVAEFERETVNPILNERVGRLKELLFDGYEITSAAGGLDGSIHYVLERRTVVS